MQITLPEPLEQFVQSKVAQRGLGCPEQYVEQLLEEERKLDEYYMEKVREGLASGPPIRVTEENREAFWNGIKENIRRKHESRQRKDAAG